MTDTNLNQLVINELTKAQYEALTPASNQLYIVTDEVPLDNSAIVTIISSSSTNDKVPSALAVYNYHDTTKYDASNPAGYTSNTGTITGITMNGASKGTSGVIDLGTVITSHQDISGKLDKNNAITGATHTKITYDSKGLVTSGADLTASDIPDLSSIYQNKLSAGQNILITSGSLPPEYEQLDYIIVSGGSSIDTNIIPDNHKTEMKVNDISYVNDKHYFGTSSGAGYYHFTTYDNKYYWGYSGFEGNSGTWSSGIHTVVYNGTNNAIILDDVTFAQNQSITSYDTLTIGKRDNTANFTGWIYYFKLTNKSTNQLVFNGIPAKRISDNVVGLYDIISSTFFTDDTGSGFGAGTSTITPSGALISSFAVDDTSSSSTTLGWSSNKLTTEFLAKESTSNKVTSISTSSTNTQYPSAKCVYDIVGNIEATLQAIRGV